MKLKDHAGEKGLPRRPLGRVAAHGELRQGLLYLLFSRGEGDQQPVHRPGMEDGGWSRGLQKTRAFTVSDSAARLQQPTATLAPGLGAALLPVAEAAGTEPTATPLFCLGSDPPPL